jgi:hypothetical protein
VQALNSSAVGSTATTFTGYALCERNAKGTAVSEVSTFSPLSNDARAVADPACTGRTHVISGGFNITPNGVGVIPVTSIDEFQPIGDKTWHLGLHEAVGFNLPLGSALQTFAYCKKG